MRYKCAMILMLSSGDLNCSSKEIMCGDSLRQFTGARSGKTGLEMRDLPNH
jgi:hypothetical protein